MSTQKHPKTRNTMAERIAFLGTCVVACIAIIATSITDCHHRSEATAPATESPAKDLHLRADTIKKKPKKDKKRHPKRKKSKAKSPAPRRIPTPRDYHKTPGDEASSNT